MFGLLAMVLWVRDGSEQPNGGVRWRRRLLTTLPGKRERGRGQWPSIPKDIPQSLHFLPIGSPHAHTHTHTVLISTRVFWRECTHVEIREKPQLSFLRHLVFLDTRSFTGLEFTK